MAEPAHDWLRARSTHSGATGARCSRVAATRHAVPEVQTLKLDPRSNKRNDPPPSVCASVACPLVKKNRGLVAKVPRRLPRFPVSV